MGLTMGSGRPLTQPVSGCGGIGALLVSVNAGIAEIQSADSLEIDAHYVRMSTALAAQHSQRAQAVEDLQAAQGGSGAELLRLSKVAAVSASDLFVAIAVQTRSPQLIGAAVGMDVVLDTGVFVIQTMTADTAGQQYEAAVMLLQGRLTMIESLVVGAAPTASIRRLEAMKALSGAAYAMGAAVVDEVRLKAELAEAERALEAIETSVAGLPVTSQDMRRWMLESLEAEKAILTILQSEYSQSDCRVDGIFPG